VDTAEFFRAVITAPSGWLLIAYSDGKAWQQLFFRWPDECDKAVARATELASTYNVYFSSYLFNSCNTTKACVVEGTRTIQADLDNADINHLPIQPTVLVESSPRRYQAYWVLTEAQDLAVHEKLSRTITYSIADCDHSGWPLGRKLRVPGTFNYKYDVPHTVKVVGAGLVPIAAEDVDTLTPLPYTPSTQADDDWIDANHACDTHGQELLRPLKDTFPSATYNRYNIIQNDRSNYLWTLMRACFRAGLDRDQVFCIARDSANNKFRDLTINGDRELAKDVERARKSVLNNEVDTRAEVNAARQTPGIAALKKQRIKDVVLNHMERQGRFMQTVDEQPWYIPNDTGRPTMVEGRSDPMRTLLESRFGLNASEIEYQYIADTLRTHSLELPATGLNCALSYYNHTAKTMYVHMGGRDIAKITAHNVDVVSEGADNVLFPWQASAQAFKLDDRGPDQPWCEMLFGNDSLKYVENMAEQEAIVLLRVWFVFMLMRHASPSRPILALLGRAGSGKSTVFKKVYKLLYGDSKEVIAPTNQAEFDQSVANNPLVAIDNQDGPVPTWFMNALALSAGTSDIERRKLFTDNDMFRMRRQAMVGLTAHEPRFARADVADRLLIIHLNRRPDNEFLDERDIMTTLLQQRSRIWWAIVKDIQCVLKTPLPSNDDVPHTRIQDFATTGYWIASALGIGPSFKRVIESINGTQKSFAVIEDQLLVSALDKFVQKSKYANELTGPGTLWTALETYSDDSNEFRRTYKSSTELSRKLWALYNSLGARYKVDSEIDHAKGTRLFAFGAKEDATD